MAAPFTFECDGTRRYRDTALSRRSALRADTAPAADTGNSERTLKSFAAFARSALRTAQPPCHEVSCPVFPMLLLDHSFDSPAHNLACDEALLEWREAEGGPNILRLWESPKYFVVLGYTNKVETETHESECARLDIPILRRTSGGGTVLQGPGCFNYSLVLSIEDQASLRNLSLTNDFVMERNRVALESTLGAPVARQGHTDLTLDGRKFSGNAQRRKQKYLLFHGTLLLDFDLPLISKVLQLPPIRPTYRADRTHEDFLVNLHVARETVKTTLREAWQTSKVLCDFPQSRIENLVAQKYLRNDWNRKF